MEGIKMPFIGFFHLFNSIPAVSDKGTDSFIIPELLTRRKSDVASFDFITKPISLLS